MSCTFCSKRITNEAALSVYDGETAHRKCFEEYLQEQSVFQDVELTHLSAPELTNLYNLLMLEISETLVNS